MILAPREPAESVFRLETDQAIAQLTEFIQKEVKAAGRQRAVLGMSGGIDSALVAHLATRALGPANVVGILLPFRTSSHESLLHAQMEIQKLGILHKTIEITPIAEALFHQIPSMDKRRMGNAMARLRMVVLYDQSEENDALVIGTSNRTETLLGYGTLHGDMAWGFNPIGCLYKTQVRQLAREIGVDPAIVGKTPTADLWAGQTDEGEIGVSYDVIDRVLYLMVDRGMSRADVVALGYAPEAVDRVAGLVAGSEFKRRTPPVATVKP
ncbi:MAG TPA: NAD+ synthase [Chloroflexota bacterium]|nr:NAD+ synthase [Chloroflexota bacterium]